MDNYFLYFPVSEKEEARGLALLNTGCTRIGKDSQYPPSAHPSHHNFGWEKGRVLQEYQLIYITRGGGLFESESCREEITEGTIILLQPGERHRYRPHPHSGWDETWVGFRGNMIDDIIRENQFGPGKAVFHVGFNETIINLFNDINRFSKGGQPGYQPVISGAILYLLGLIYSESLRDKSQTADMTETMVNKARALFRLHVDNKLSPEQVAEELHVGYSLFRKAFKKYTGVAPGQYLIGLKIEMARQLLADPNKLIKEIAFELNMDSSLYFCKLFKEKVGMTPVEYRRRVIKN
jgi:AraC-like DNA-binding protein